MGDQGGQCPTQNGEAPLHPALNLGSPPVMSLSTRRRAVMKISLLPAWGKSTSKRPARVATGDPAP